MKQRSNPRNIKRIVVNFNSYNIVTSISILVTGGNTTGAHQPSFRDGGYHCDCIGFMSHGKCRHVDLVKDVQESVQNSISSTNKT